MPNDQDSFRKSIESLGCRVVPAPPLDVHPAPLDRPETASSYGRDEPTIRRLEQQIGESREAVGRRVVEVMRQNRDPRRGE